ncbi:MAG TPA: NADH-quinone oxidoreductase subunit A [Fimbriimonadaceae bacterium]|nr:NADH-quinone oxidoreductase subunit A [Fimbriimonadaceae bacterium]
MEGEYLGILVLVALAAVISAVMVTGSWLLGPKKITPYKQSTYECGVTPVGDAKERFPVKFYLVAMLFILFDIEVVFLWSWMTVYAHSETAFKLFSFVEMILYMSTWILGYVYAIRVRAMDWEGPADLETELAPEPDDLPEPRRTLQPAAGGQ